MKHKKSIFNKLLTINLLLFVLVATAFAQKGKNEINSDTKINKTDNFKEKTIRQNFRSNGIDETFVPQLVQYDWVSAADLQEDGKIVVGGKFSRINPKDGTMPRLDGILRLNSDGSIDQTFNFEEPRYWQTEDPVSVIKIQPDGKILAAKDWRMIRFNADGSIDQSFNQPTFSFNYSRIKVYGINLYEDGKILVSGSFGAVDGQSSYNIARLNSDGTLDQSFQRNDAGGHVYVQKAALTKDGKIYLGLYNQNWDSIGLFPRLNPNGETDYSFRWSKTAGDFKNAYEWSEMTDVIVEPDGNLIISGWITNWSGAWNENIKGIYRMSPNGELLKVFEPRRMLGSKIYQQTDGKIIALSSGGDAQDPANLIRFFPDGQRDYSFNHAIPHFSVNFPLGTGVLIQKDGKVLVYGQFRTANGMPVNGIVRFYGEN